MFVADIARLLADNLKRIRGEKGLTQGQLAEKANVSFGTIQGYESTRRWPELPYVKAIAKALDVPEDELFTDRSRNQFDKTEEMLELWLRADDVTRETVLNLLRPAHVSQKERKS